MASKKVGPITTCAVDLTTVVKGHSEEPSEAKYMVSGDGPIPLVFGVQLADEPASLSEEWAK